MEDGNVSSDRPYKVEEEADDHAVVRFGTRVDHRRSREDDDR